MRAAWPFEMSSSVATRLQSICMLSVDDKPDLHRVGGLKTHGFEVQLLEDCVEESGCMAFSWHGLAASDGRHGVSGLRGVLCFSAQKGNIICSSEFSVKNLEMRDWEA